MSNGWDSVVDDMSSRVERLLLRIDTNRVSRRDKGASTLTDRGNQSGVLRRVTSSHRRIERTSRTTMSSLHSSSETQPVGVMHCLHVGDVQNIAHASKTGRLTPRPVKSINSPS